MPDHSLNTTSVVIHPNSLLSIPDISNFGTSLQLHMENCLFQPTINSLPCFFSRIKFFQQFLEFFLRVIIFGILRDPKPIGHWSTFSIPGAWNFHFFINVFYYSTNSDWHVSEQNSKYFCNTTLHFFVIGQKWLFYWHSCLGSTLQKKRFLLNLIL